MGKKPLVAKRCLHSRSDAALHLERSSPLCPTHLTGCNTGTGAGTHSYLPSSARQFMAVLALALGRDPKPYTATAVSPLGPPVLLPKQRLSACVQTGRWGQQHVLSCSVTRVWRGDPVMLLVQHG